MEERLPFAVSARNWSDLSDDERSFFQFDDEYLPLPADHAAKISLVEHGDATRLATWAFASIPPGWPDRADGGYAIEERLGIRDSWNDPVRREDVRRWLYERGVPFGRTVYLLYERDRVVRTTWQMAVKYWDAFAWSVGYAMIATDHTLQWACCFHHEDVIVFGKHGRPA